MKATRSDKGGKHIRHKKTKNKNYNIKSRKIAIELRANGLSYQDIANYFKTSRQWIYYLLNYS